MSGSLPALALVYGVLYRKCGGKLRIVVENESMYGSFSVGMNYRGVPYEWTCVRDFDNAINIARLVVALRQLLYETRDR